MLNSAAPVAPGPLSVVAAEGAPDQGDSTFAVALDQAAAQQREAGPPEGVETARRPAGRTRGVGGGADVTGDALHVDALTGLAVAPSTATSLPLTPAVAEDEGQPEPPHEPTPQDLAAWVSALPLPNPAAAPPPAAATGTAACATEIVGDTSTPRAARKAEPAPFASAADLSAPSDHERLAPAQPRATAPLPPGDAATAGLGVRDTAPGAVAALPAAATREPAPTAALGADAATSPLAALVAAPPGGPPHGAERSAPFQAELRAAVASDAFAPELGARLSVLVRDGIEHAQLRLNPAELGPIEVRIDLDGQRAQVDFSAAHASTRQALQDAVPALASALRESGLTLTGGGVFEQAREQRGDAAPRDARQAAASMQASTDEAPPLTTTPRMPRARGVLDLYA